MTFWRSSWQTFERQWSVKEISRRKSRQNVQAPAGVVEPTLQVEIRFYEDCWTEIIDGRGERLFYGLGSVGAQTQFTATPPLSFFLGNVDGVVLFVDEMPYAIPAESRRGNIAEFVIPESAD